MSFYTRTLYVLGALIVGRTDCSVCDTDNGGCSQNCVPIGSEENLCTCRNGYQLNSTNHKSCFAVGECGNHEACSRLCDKNNDNCVCAEGYSSFGECKTIAHDVFLLCTRLVEVQAISLENPQLNSVALSLNNLTGVIAVDYYSKTDSIFWTDVLWDTINTAKIDGSNQQVIVRNVTTSTGIAVDWLASKIYWTQYNTTSFSINVAELDGSNCTVLIQGDMEQPQDIVVHPFKRILFWSYSDGVPRIERANVDGSDRVLAVTNLTGKIHGLALDYECERLYWCIYMNNGSSTLEYANFDGSGRKTLLNPIPNSLFFGLALYGDHLYWTDRKNLLIQSVHKTTGDGVVTFVKNLKHVWDVEVFSHRYQQATEEESVQSPLPSPVESTSTTAVISQAYNFILDNKPEMISGTNQSKRIHGRILLVPILLCFILVVILVTLPLSFFFFKRLKRLKCGENGASQDSQLSGNCCEERKYKKPLIKDSISC